MRSADDIEQAMTLHGDAVWRACLAHAPRNADAQDAFQTAFVKFAEHEGAFESEEHRKAWLLRVAINACKDLAKRACAHDGSLDAWQEQGLDVEDNADESFVREVLDAVRGLGEPPRAAVYLAVYEGYTAPEISKMLNAPVNTIYSWIARGKRELREVLA